MKEDKLYFNKILITKKVETKFHGSILDNDNVLILSGRRICIIYDADFSSYLVEHALPLLDNE